MGVHRNQMSRATARTMRARLLGLLKDCAERGEPCPTLQALGKQLGKHPKVISYMLCRLREERHIRWTIKRRSTGSTRIVTIVATGRRTATPPRVSARKRRTASVRAAATVSDIELERAKTRLRRLGVIVFDATITDGKAARGLIKVDGRNITPQQVLERAARFGP